MTRFSHVKSPIVDQLGAALGPAYTIERELEGGGMSRVFVAFDDVLQRRVAVKVLPEHMAAAVSVARFRREILVSAGLQHPRSQDPANPQGGLWLSPPTPRRSLAETTEVADPGSGYDTPG